MKNTVMSPSTTRLISEGQSIKFNDLQVAALRKSGLPHKETQQVLEQEGTELVNEFVASVRRRVERRAETVVRHFKVDRTKSPQVLLDAIGRVQYVDKSVLATMPNEGPEEGDLYFFPIKRSVPFADVPAELESRGLIPDPAAQAQVNADDPSFADEHPNGVQWNLEGRVASFATFDRWGDERLVDVNRDDSSWDDYVWFGGRRKES